MIVWLLIAGVAWAGAPPPSDIPWDSVWVQDTILVNHTTPPAYTDTLVTDGYWCHYIRRVDYEARVLGWGAARTMHDMKRDLRAIKAAVQAKEER